MNLNPLSPYLSAIKAAAVVIAIGAIWFGVWHYGHTRYEEGRADDHKGWDADRAQWQAALDLQKITASKLLVATISQNDALRRANDALHAQQEKDYANHRAETDALHVKLAHVGLRFVAQAAPAARCGNSGGGSVPGTASKAEPAASAVVQLPDQIASDLWGLAYSADQLRDAYARCVAAVNGGPAL
jgi:hypothetical protein